MNSKFQDPQPQDHSAEERLHDARGGSVPTDNPKQQNDAVITTFAQFVQHADYSYINTLQKEPCSNRDTTETKEPREVCTGHWVSVLPAPLPDPEYVIHSKTFFKELGLDDRLAMSPEFVSLFTGDTSVVKSQLPRDGEVAAWATGYALSIFGEEYLRNCPFKTGNAYGDGRAAVVFEGVFGSNDCGSAKSRYAMQLKGSGKTPYSRAQDGRAVLRSSIREFLAEEFMHAAGIPTTRALCLYVSKSETVQRPWYSSGCMSKEPDILRDEPTAIATRVAPSFIRVGQLELYGRRARRNEHPSAREELEQLVNYMIDVEFPEIAASSGMGLHERVPAFAKDFRSRLCGLIAQHMGVGFIAGNSNSDNCAPRTLDFGPFGFLDAYASNAQSWTGGGSHFAFGSQPLAAAQNYKSFISALLPLFCPPSADASLSLSDKDAAVLNQLKMLLATFTDEMESKLNDMLASKLGLTNPLVARKLFDEVEPLLAQTPCDWTIFWRELSHIPTDVEGVKVSFYICPVGQPPGTLFLSLNQGLRLTQPTFPTYTTHQEEMEKRWNEWLSKWQEALRSESRPLEEVKRGMLRTNPKYVPREWLLSLACTAAQQSLYSSSGERDYSLVHELCDVFNAPYDEHPNFEERFYKKKDLTDFGRGGVSHCSCSS